MGRDREHRKDHDRRRDPSELDELTGQWLPSPGKVARSGAAAAGSRPRRVEAPTPGRVTLTMGLERGRQAAPLFRHATGSAEPAAGAGDLVKAARASSGRPLPEVLARRLEPSLGPAVGDIRVHDDSAAAAAARAVHAEAFTVGRDIYFADGAYDPSSLHGQRLIAHEAAHAATQPRFLPVADDIAVSQPGDAHEREADAFADAFAARAEAAARGGAPADKREKRNGKAPNGRAAAKDAGTDARKQASKEPLPAPTGPAPVALYRRVAESAQDADAAEARRARTRRNNEAEPEERDESEVDADTGETSARPGHGAPHAHSSGDARPGVGGGQVAALRQGMPEPTRPRSVDRKGEKGGKPKSKEAPPTVALKQEPDADGADGPKADKNAGPQKRGKGGARGKGGPIQFAPTDLGKLLPPIGPDETVEQRHNNERAALAEHEAARQHATATISSFVAGGRQQIAGIQQLGPGLDAQLKAGETRAIAQVDSAAAAQVRAVRAQVAASIGQVEASAAATRGQIEADYSATVTAIEDSTRDGKQRIDTAHQTAMRQVEQLQTQQLQMVGTLYEEAAGKFRDAGASSGSLAVGNAGAMANEYLSHMIHRDDSWLKGPLTDNRCKARADAARAVGDKFREGLAEEATKQVGEMNKRRPTDEQSVRTIADEARTTLETAHRESLKGLDDARTQSLEAAESAKTAQLAQVDSTRSATVSGLNQHGQAQSSAIQSSAGQLKQSIRQQRQSSSAQLHESLEAAQAAMGQGIDALLEGLQGQEVPAPEALDQSIATAEQQLGEQIGQLRQGMSRGAAQAAQGLVQTAGKGSQSLQQQGSQAIATANQTAASARESFAAIADGGRKSMKALSSGHQRVCDGSAKAAEQGMQQVVTGLRGSYDRLTTNFREGSAKNAAAIQEAFNGAVTGGGEKDMPQVIKSEAEKAAAEVQPRWKSVLKWVIIIAIIIVVAVVLGPMVIGAVAAGAAALGAGAAATAIGTIVGGALVGAAASALTTVVDNAFSGRGLMEGVWQAAGWGALGGAIGGAFGVGRLGQLIQGMSKGRQFAVQLAIDASVDTGMNAFQGNLSWETFGQGLFMSVLTNGISAHPKVGDIQARSTSIGENFGTNVGQRIRPPRTDVSGPTPTPTVDAPDVTGPGPQPDTAGGGPRNDNAPRTDTRGTGGDRGGAPTPGPRGETGPRTDTAPGGDTGRGGPTRPAPDRIGGTMPDAPRTQPGGDQPGTGGTRDGAETRGRGDGGETRGRGDGGETRGRDGGETRGRDGDGAETRGRDDGGETRGRDDGAETRGRADDGETRGRDDGGETRGRDDGGETRGRDGDTRGRDGDTRGRDGDGAETRGRDGETRGRDGETRGRDGDGAETRGRDGETRGRDGEGRGRDDAEGTRDQDADTARTEDSAPLDVDASVPVGPGGFRSDAISLTGKGDQLGDAVKWIKPEPGKIDVVVHGSSDSFFLLKDGAYVRVDHRTLAKYIEKSGGAGQEIRLISCGTGDSPTSIAQHLANKLGARVTAPSDTIWIHPDGSLTIGKNPAHNTGNWNAYEPGVRPDAGNGTRPGDTTPGTRPEVDAGPGTRPEVDAGPRPDTEGPSTRPGEEGPIAAEGPTAPRSNPADERLLDVLNGGSRDEIKLATGFDDAQVDLIIARRPIGKVLDLQSIDGVTPRQAGDLQARQKWAQIELDDSPALAGLRNQFRERVDLLRADPANAHKSDYDLMRDVVRADPGTFCLKGECVPLDVLQAHGAFAKVIGMESVFNYHLTPDARARLKNDFGIDSARDFAAAVARDPSILDPSMLDSSSMVSGQNNVAWWAPRGDSTAGSAAELVSQLALDPAYYNGGLIRVSMSPDAAAGAQFRKPTPFDGMMFGEWVANRAGGPLGLTGGGTPEAVAPGVALGGASNVEIFAGSAPPISRASGDGTTAGGATDAGPVSAGPVADGSSPPITDGPVSAGPPRDGPVSAAPEPTGTPTDGTTPRTDAPATGDRTPTTGDRTDTPTTGDRTTDGSNGSTEVTPEPATTPRDAATTPATGGVEPAVRQRLQDRGLDAAQIDRIASEFGVDAVRMLDTMTEAGVQLRVAQDALTLARDIGALQETIALVNSGKLDNIRGLRNFLREIRDELKAGQIGKYNELVDAAKRAATGHEVGLGGRPLDPRDPKSGKADIVDHDGSSLPDRRTDSNPDAEGPEAVQMKTVLSPAEDKVLSNLQDAVNQLGGSGREFPPVNYRRVADIRIQGPQNPLTRATREELLAALRGNIHNLDNLVPQGAPPGEIRITNDRGTHVFSVDELR